jgi:hypothetical protein
MTNRLLPVLAAAVSLFSAGRSRAADQVPIVGAAPSSEPQTAVGLNLGLGSALGLGGVTLTEAFSRFTRLELGAGYGASGYQLSVMPKMVLGRPHDHFVAGAGISLALPTDSRLASGHPIWLNLDALGYEHRFDSGIAVSAAFGVTGGLGGGEVCLPTDGCEPQFLRPVSDYWFPQGRVGIAYWF